MARKVVKEKLIVVRESRQKKNDFYTGHLFQTLMILEVKVNKKNCFLIFSFNEHLFHPHQNLFKDIQQNLKIEQKNQIFI